MKIGQNNPQKRRSDLLGTLPNWVKDFLEQSDSYSIYRERFHYLLWAAERNYELGCDWLKNQIVELEGEIADRRSSEIDLDHLPFSSSPIFLLVSVPSYEGIFFKNLNFT